uniref:AP-4 complex accessory subunit Tepsin VHS/ENTH-like domain-containing protein n=1 Tax=Melopsittacus undulatus TaxID=13146 RepID=A0A8V5G8S2_MELUD
MVSQSKLSRSLIVCCGKVVPSPSSGWTDRLPASADWSSAAPASRAAPDWFICRLFTSYLPPSPRRHQSAEPLPPGALPFLAADWSEPQLLALSLVLGAPRGAEPRGRAGTGGGAVMASPLRDRLSFLSRLPVLLRGTADEDAPCPGYLLEEIAKISHESAGSSRCLLEFLLGRLRSGSCHVKLKVLRILLHTCSRGSPHFLLQLQGSACCIREAAAFTGPPDPLHGNSLNQKVRAAAQVSITLLPCAAPFHIQPQVWSVPGGLLPCRVLGALGLCWAPGNHPRPWPSAGSAGEALLSTIQRAAEAVAHAVLPSPGGHRPPHRDLHEDTYEPVRAPSPPRSPTEAGKPPAATTTHGTRARHQPGLAGGGWEEADSGHSSQDSSQGIGDLSRTSDSCSKSGSDGHCGAIRELSHAAERVDTDSLGDCVREVSLVAALTRGDRVFLTREEAQHFVKECGLLNCEVVLELLSRALQDPSDSVRMRSMGAISSLMCSDLLSLDQIFAVTRLQLQQLSQGSPGPVANRAMKVTRGVSPCPLPRGTRLTSDPSALPAGSAPCPGDLLLDIPPVPGESILTPLSAAPLPGACSREAGVEAETCGQPSAAVPARPCGQEAVSRGPGDVVGAPALSRSLSLFAGMELVAPPGAGAVLHQDSPSAEPWAPSQPHMDKGSEQQPSAFAFLNM